MGLSKENQFFVFWSFLGAIGVLIIWQLPWRFQVNDDEAMMWLVSGAYTGQPESYAVFIHPILSLALSKLYTISSDIHWYPLIWFSILYCSYLTGIRIIHQKMAISIIAHIWSLVLFAFLIHFTFFLQFSIVSAFAVSVGLAYRFWKFLSIPRRPTLLFKTDFLILIGFLIRPEVAYLFLAGFLGFGVVFFRSKSFFGASLLPIFMLLIGSSFSYLWISQNNLNEFVQLNSLRSKVFDHPMLQHQKEVWKYTDPPLYFFANGLQDFDQPNLNTITLDSWKEKLDGSRSRFINFEFFQNSIWTSIKKEHFFIFLGIITLLFSCTLLSLKSLISAILIFFGLVILAPFYLIKVQIYAMAFLLFLMVMILQQSTFRWLPSFLNFGFIAILVLGITFHISSFFKMEEKNIDSQDVQNQLNDLRQKGFEQIFLVGGNKYYQEMVFFNPIPFKLLGWTSLFERFNQRSPNRKTAYLVEKSTFLSNYDYFKEKEVSLTYLEDFVLVHFP